MSALECPLLGSNSGMIYFRFGHVARADDRKLYGCPI